MDDQVQPFQLEAQPVRGRLVRLGALVSSIVEKHDYPDPVATLLSEVVTLATVLSTGLKYEGVFSLQTSGKGPVRLLVADVTSGGDVRGYAQFDADRVSEAARAAPGADAGLRPSAARLLGPGYLAFTVDQGQNTERYQGIVELTGSTLVDCVHHYFRQSEQLATGIRLAVERDGEGGWRGAALLLQRMPPAAGAGAEDADDADEEAFDEPDDDDGWRRALTLLATASDEELLDPGLTPHDLLYRLFHEEGVRVYRPRALRAGCRCSRERVERVLRSLTRAEIASLEEEDGAVVATCEFCSAAYRFTREQVDALVGADGPEHPRQ